MANLETLSKTDSVLCKTAANAHDKSSSQIKSVDKQAKHAEGLEAFAAWANSSASAASKDLAAIPKKLDAVFNPKDFTPGLQIDVLHDLNENLTKHWADRIAKSALQKAALDKAESGATSPEEKKKLANYEPTGEELHAFRHAITAAIYSAKYEPWLAESLGAAAEVKEAFFANANTKYAEHARKEERLFKDCAFWTYEFRTESNFDLLNNGKGAAIAADLKKQKQHWNTEDFVKMVAKAELDGKIYRDFNQTWDSGHKSREIRFFPSVPNLKNQSLKDSLKMAKFWQY